LGLLLAMMVSQTFAHGYGRFGGFRGGFFNPFLFPFFVGAEIIRHPVPVPVVIVRNKPADYRDKRNHINSVNDNEFYTMKKEMFSYNNEDDRVTFLKNRLDTYYFTAFQVSTLINGLSYEGNRLQIAELAYNKTIDTKNYYMVFDELKFDASKRDLDNYIQQSANCKR